MSARSPLGKAIEAGYRAEPIVLADVLEEIERQAGSGRKAAALIGIGETTWRRWKKGATARPKAANLAKAQVAVRAVRVQNRPMRIDELRINTTDGNGRQRKLFGSQFGFTDAHVSKIQSAYIEAGPDAAARALVEELNHTGPGINFYHGYLDGLQYDGVDEAGEYGAVAAQVKW